MILSSPALTTISSPWLRCCITLLIVPSWASPFNVFSVKKLGSWSGLFRSKSLSFFSFPPVKICVPLESIATERTMWLCENVCKQVPLYVSHTLLQRNDPSETCNPVFSTSQSALTQKSRRYRSLPLQHLHQKAWHSKQRPCDPKMFQSSLPTNLSACKKKEESKCQWLWCRQNPFFWKLFLTWDFHLCS